MQLACRFLFVLGFLIVGCSDQTNQDNSSESALTPADESAATLNDSSTEGVASANRPSVSPPQQAIGRLIIPVANVEANDLSDMFTDSRSGGRVHDAIDIMAPTGTPVYAAASGKVAKLFLSDKGGKTIYHTVAGTDYMLYYAHLDAYAEGLKEGQDIRQGDLIGYVGATGNANPDGPHLHFAVHELEPDKSWWKGTPVNPYPYLTGALTLPPTDDAP